MPPPSPLELRPIESHLEELPPHARLPRLDLGIDWERSGEVFRTSLEGVLTGPPAPKDSELKKVQVLRVDWVEGKLPGRSFLAAVLWHVVIICLLILPIWGFLPEVKQTLPPLEVEMTVYDPTDLPTIKLPANTPKSVKKPDEPAKQPPQQGADAFHPRQTIISIPVRVTHPRQTLIRPDAPPAPPKIVTPLPNIVQWSETNLKRPHLELAPTASAPRLRHHTVADAVAPDVAKNEKTPGPIDVAPSPVTIARPKIVLDAMSTSVAQRHATHADAGPAPEVGAASEEGDAGLRRIIALSATPAPPAPEISVPEGNLAARISISPEGGKPGAAAHGVATSGENGGGASASAGVASSAGGASGSSLPAAVSISGAPVRPGNGGNAGGITPSGNRAGALNLKPMTPYEPSGSTRKGPVDVTKLDPSLPPEKILSGKEVYTQHVNMPNLTSASGSWIMDFAELDEQDGPPKLHKELVACPVPVEKADPKYPPELIKEHVKGQVVLYAIVRKDGSVDSIQIVRGLDPQLDHNAIEALERWKFRPGTRAGTPTDFEGVIYVPFSYVNPRE